MKKILVIVQHRKDRSPGQRFRFEQYIPALEAAGYEIIFSNILNEKNDRIFYSHGKLLSKLRIVIKSFFHRLQDLKTAKNCDIVFIYREAFMMGTSYFEKRFSKCGKPVIFDFDDSIWLNDTSEGNQSLAWMKKPKKTADICKYANLVTVGNQYLADYALKYNSNIFILPTTINTEYHKPIKCSDKSEKICIGWTGTTTTLKHFDTASPILKKLKEKYADKIYFKVIVNSEKWVRDIDVKFIKWSLKNEISDLCEFDIGIMPLPDNEWSNGKCGFKGLQCMALEMPVVMSPVGVNTEIISHGINGFLANSEQEWFEILCKLVENADLRKIIGKEARKTVEDSYSVHTWQDKVLKKIEEL